MERTAKGKLGAKTKYSPVPQNLFSLALIEETLLLCKAYDMNNKTEWDFGSTASVCLTYPIIDIRDRYSVFFDSL